MEYREHLANARRSRILMCRSWSIIKAEARAEKRRTSKITAVHPETAFLEKPFDLTWIAPESDSHLPSKSPALTARPPSRKREPGKDASKDQVNHQLCCTARPRAWLQPCRKDGPQGPPASAVSPA